MRVDLFDFDLPDSLIAEHPVEPRDAARLLVVGPGDTLGHRIFRDLPDLLEPGDLLVVDILDIGPLPDSEWGFNGVFANVLLFLTVFLITFLLPKYLELPTEATIALITAVTYSPDGTRIATASSDQTARVWDATSSALVATLRGHESALGDITFSPDGAHVATASNDFTAKIWDPESGELLIDLTDRIGLRAPDGSITWPIPLRELTRIGCLRLMPLAPDDPEVVELCDSLATG